MTKQSSFRCEYCGTSYVYQQSLDMHLIGCSYRQKAVQQVVKVYPKKEQLNNVVQSLELVERILTHLKNHTHSSPEQMEIAIDLVIGQITELKSLYESKT